MTVALLTLILGMSGLRPAAAAAADPPARAGDAEPRRFDPPAPGPLPGGGFLQAGRGGTAEMVRLVQRRLTRSGFPAPADGLFGPRTEAAVQGFQRARGLLIDGVVGRQTDYALRFYGTSAGASRRGARRRKPAGVGLGAPATRRRPTTLRAVAARDREYTFDLRSLAGERIVSATLIALGRSWRLDPARLRAAARRGRVRVRIVRRAGRARATVAGVSARARGRPGTAVGAKAQVYRLRVVTLPPRSPDPDSDLDDDDDDADDDLGAEDDGDSEEDPGAEDDGDSGDDELDAEGDGDGGDDSSSDGDDPDAG